MGDQNVKVLEHGARVTVRGTGVQRITLDRRTIAKINDNRPKQVVQRRDTPVNVTDRNTLVRAGGGMGPQGPRGEPGQNGDSIAPITFSHGDAAHDVFTAPVDGTFTIVRLDISTPFDGSGASIKVGTAGDHEALMPATANDPGEFARFEEAADLFVTANTGVRLEINAGGGATQGAGVLYLTFVPSE